MPLWQNLPAKEVSSPDGTRSLLVGEDCVMQDTDEPVLTAMVDKLIDGPGSVVELGYGMGFSSAAILAKEPVHYVVFEVNRAIAMVARRAIGPQGLVLPSDWRVGPVPPKFDFVLFDTSPYDGKDYPPFDYRLLRFIHEDTRISFYCGVIGPLGKRWLTWYSNQQFDHIEVYTQADKVGRQISFPVCSSPKIAAECFTEACPLSNQEIDRLAELMLAKKDKRLHSVRCALHRVNKGL
jgi:hypothetical protein